MSKSPSSPAAPPQLFLDEPSKTEEALDTFIEISESVYSNEEIAGAGSNNFITCDCYEDFHEGENQACDEFSDCINRLTLIECVNGKSQCGKNCRNQRFQKKEYAPVAVFQTEKKGYGVRAEADIEAHQFIYEYVGDVITETEFRARMVDYDKRGFKHFYFMMLQKGEFIDATIKGCLARFCNHSCMPNAYVNKWVVCGKLRMGLFASRKIQRGEEITFDYNVDRYGANAQPCYCNSPNCLGFLGGKTQTEAASLLPANIADALGVSMQEEKDWIKWKREMGQKIDKTSINTEFVDSLTMSPLNVEDVTKVMGVLMQVDEMLIANKLMDRIFVTHDETVKYQIIKLHGYQVFAKLLSILDDSYVESLLQYLLELPKTSKNVIVGSQIDKAIEKLGSRHAEVCQNLKEKWDKFETYTRIPKKMVQDAEPMDSRRRKLPPGWELKYEDNKVAYFHPATNLTTFTPPTAVSLPVSRTQSPNPNTPKIKRERSQSELEERKRRRMEWQQQELNKKKLEEQKLLQQKLHKEEAHKSELQKIIDEANRSAALANAAKKSIVHAPSKTEMKWNHFFAHLVPNLIRQFEPEIGRDAIKSCARNIVKILTEKELKRNSEPPREVTPEKRNKVKDFSMGYMNNFMSHRQRK